MDDKETIVVPEMRIVIGENSAAGEAQNELGGRAEVGHG